ncbi:MAG: hypothetical protein ACLQVI_32355 [Polyangiaceae bacterium]|jgi:hypothetical protein
MNRLFLSALPILFAGLAATSCNGTTGDELITFPAYAAGAQGASEPFSSNGYTIQLTFAQMWIGAVYVDESPLSTGAESPICTNPGVYAAQVPGGVEVDLLSTSPQPFAVQGNGSADLGQSWELWLVDGDVNAPSNSTYDTPNIVDLQGTATRQSDGAVFSWAATVNIDQSNRGIPVSDPSQPGLNPICKQRILEEGGLHEQLFADGQLVVTVDPRGWFNGAIDFSSLPPVASDECEIDNNSIYGNATYCIPDTSFGTGLGATQGSTLFNNIYTGGPSAYSLSFSKLP